MNVSSISKWGLVAVMGCVLGAGLSIPAGAQDDKMNRPDPEPEAIIYRDRAYNGPAVKVSRPRPDMGLAWRVNSIRVKSGRWQLCEKPNYRGDCRTFDADRPIIGLRRGIEVQSLRPLGWVEPGVPGKNPSLKGMATEFYSAPALNGRRVLACSNGGGTANCAADTADRFCRSMGWNGSAYQRMETVSRRIYLADTLCVRSGY